MQRIQKKYLSKSVCYTDRDFRLDAQMFYEECRQAHEVRVADGTAAVDARFSRKFVCSGHFAQDFRARHAISLRRPSLKRRPTTTPDQIECFIERVRELLHRYPSEKIVNIDETNWKTVAAGFLTWSPVAAESVNCHIDNDQKFGITAIAAITADGKKLPLTVIGKGKTERCLRGYELPKDIWTYTSQSGWTNAEIICGYLRRLKALDGFREGPLIVLLDTYAAHRCARVREVAAVLEIDLVFIPPGATDKLQPLDRYVFGVLKAFARQQWRIYNHRREGASVTRNRMAEHLVQSWNRITPEIIEKSWDIYRDESWSEPEMMHGPERDHDGDFQPMICLHDIADLN
jgi:hypothetical protein